jgi:hypothetical protein
VEGVDRGVKRGLLGQDRGDGSTPEPPGQTV